MDNNLLHPFSTFSPFSESQGQIVGARESLNGRFPIVVCKERREALGGENATPYT